VLKPQFGFEWQNVLLFIMTLLVAWALRFFWGFWLALLAFWSTRADGLLTLQDSMIIIVGGQVAPTSLLPPVIQFFATILPFRFMAAFPVEVLTGQLSQSEIHIGFTLQVFWMMVALGMYMHLWIKGVQKYSAVGG
jgi:ABC-2 type transport system permease protein